MPIANQAKVPASVIGMIPPMSKSDHARSPIEIAASTASTTRSAFSRQTRERPRASRVMAKREQRQQRVERDLDAQRPGGREAVSDVRGS